MKKAALFFALLFTVISLLAQNNGNTYDVQRARMQERFESMRSNARKQFDDLRRKADADYAAFRKKANEEYASYLEKAWEWKTGEKPKPATPKVPDIPPVVLPDIDIDIPEDNPIDVDINYPELEDEPIRVAPIPYNPKPSEKSISFTFYGTQGRIRFDISKRVNLTGADENAVARFWKALSGEAYDNVVADCQSIRYDRDLCDWAYYKMTEKVAEALYNTGNERAVFHAWLLSQSGFSMRLGRENGNIHLLPGTNSLLFGKPYWKFEDGYYSLLDGERNTAMYIMDVQFPGTSPIRTRMISKNLFVKSITDGRMLASKKYPETKARVSCEKNTLAFLQDIPLSAIAGTDETDYLMYAFMPISEKAGHDLLPVLFEQVAGKTEAEAANILLDFVQTAFEYKTDGEVWGHERPFFPEETLYYPYSDCEDRAILYCSLVREVLKLEVAFVSYPGHLATAIHFNEEGIPGDYFIVNGKRYLICDPTYINASIGRTMPRMNNATAKVFLME